jgi:acyl transferase domain-containing protein
MAKTKKEEVAQEAKPQEQPKENVTKVDLSKFESKDDDNVIKVDLSKTQKKEEDTVQKQSTGEVPVRDESETSEKVVEEVVEETDKKPTEQKEEKKEEVVLEEITEEEEKLEEAKEEVVKAVEEAEATGKPLPESVEKLIKFMEETGGDLQDYVRLNQDYKNLDDKQVVYEHYKQTKPHLTNEEINFLIEDSFSYDEEIDEERDIKRKKLAYKEQVASARAYLDGQKSTYYEEIKAGSKLTPEQQKAINFFNRYNKESEETNKVVKQNQDIFNKKTNDLFNANFKGFEYNVGDKKFRFNVKNSQDVKEAQSDLNKFVSKFVDENKTLKDAKGYHKSLFTAMNADTIAQHFYEQGKADALKESIAKSKNIDMNPRQSHGEISAGGIKVKVLGDTSSDFKFKIKNNK